MADNRKYYYLKLKENFFDSDEMIILESMQDGYLYSNILLKLYLRSLKYDGRLMFNDKIPFNSEMLAKVTRHNVGVIEKAMRVFRDLGLIEVLDSGAIYITDIQNFIGESSTEADRKRRYRMRIAAEKELLPEGQMSGQVSDDCPDKTPPELDIEIDTELDIEIDNISTPFQIFNYWNDQNIIQHRKLDDKTKRAITSALKDYTSQEIQQAIANYSEIVNSDRYFFSYKWTLENFLKRPGGLSQFLNWEVCSQNYLVKPKKKPTGDYMDNMMAAAQEFDRKEAEAREGRGNG